MPPGPTAARWRRTGPGRGGVLGEARPWPCQGREALGGAAGADLHSLRLYDGSASGGAGRVEELAKSPAASEALRERSGLRALAGTLPWLAEQRLVDQRPDPGDLLSGRYRWAVGAGLGWYVREVRQRVVQRQPLRVRDLCCQRIIAETRETHGAHRHPDRPRRRGAGLEQGGRPGSAL